MNIIIKIYSLIPKQKKKMIFKQKKINEWICKVLSKNDIDACASHDWLQERRVVRSVWGWLYENHDSE
jgi:hypothetical protein